MPRRSQFEIWEAEFGPIPNHLEPDCGLDGCLYETFGDELDHVRSVLAQAPARIWTVVEAEGKWYITHGFRHVNRIGYLVTERALDANNPVHQKRYVHRDVFYI